jgi:hypothetical protein
MLYAVVALDAGDGVTVRVVSSPFMLALELALLFRRPYVLH